MLGDLGAAHIKMLGRVVETSSITPLKLSARYFQICQPNVSTVCGVRTELYYSFSCMYRKIEPSEFMSTRVSYPDLFLLISGFPDGLIREYTLDIACLWSLLPFQLEGGSHLKPG
jgi:hypothetical protein